MVLSIIALAFSGASLLIAFTSLLRNPKVLWAKDRDVIESMDELDEVEPHIWKLELTNRGRAVATAVRTRFIERDGTKTAWGEDKNVGQGETLRLRAGITAGDLAQLGNPFQPRNRGPAFELEWRGTRDRKRPHRRVYSPSELGTRIES